MKQHPLLGIFARLMAGAAWMYSLGPLTLRKVLRAVDSAPLQAEHKSSQACYLCR